MVARPGPLPDQALIVDDLDDILARIGAHGGRLVREVAQFESYCRYCYVHGPEGIVVGLVEPLG